MPPVSPHALLDTLPFGIARFDRDFMLRYANARLAAACGAAPEQLVGRFVDVLGLPPDRQTEWEAAARRVFESGTERRLRYLATVDGQEQVVGHILTPERDANGTVASLLYTHIAGESLPAIRTLVGDPEYKFHAFMDHLPCCAWVRDEQGRFVYLNRTYEESVGCGHGTWLGKTLDDVWPTDSAVLFQANDRKVLDTDRPVETYESGLTPDGVHRTWFIVKFPFRDGGVRYVAGIGIDVTERRRMDDERRALERQLLHAQKLESLGVMAGGVAHDFNNLLTTILGNSSMARMNAGTSGPIADCLGKIEQASLRAADLCSQMLVYSGRGTYTAQAIDLNTLVQDMATLLGSVISKKAVIKYNLSAGLPTVRGDEAQLRQLILNLITNASDAIGRTSGVITLTTGTLSADAAYLENLALTKQLTPGTYAYLEVSDTGTGMDESTKARIFEPFFSTKFAGRGLGLAASQGVVRGHNGAIKVYTQAGKGSTFKVLLPIAAATSPAPGPDLRNGRGNTVLVIDDEDDVRSVARRLLEQAGFNVLLAIDGLDGVNTFQTFHHMVSAVLLDLTMPRMGGADAFRELRRIRSDVKVVLMSGYGRQEALSGFEGKGLSSFLRKPFTAEELVNAVFAAVGG